MCQLADEHGRVLAEARGPGANLQALGELEVEKVLHELIDDALGDRDPCALDAICLGMAGVDRPRRRRDDSRILRRIGHRARAAGRQRRAHRARSRRCRARRASCSSPAPGRSRTAATRSGRAARAGGWGYVLGDEGSGYWLGRQALRAVMRAADGRGPATTADAASAAHHTASAGRRTWSAKSTIGGMRPTRDRRARHASSTTRPRRAMRWPSRFSNQAPRNWRPRGFGRGAIEPARRPRSILAGGRLPAAATLAGRVQRTAARDAAGVDVRHARRPSRSPGRCGSRSDPRERRRTRARVPDRRLMMRIEIRPHGRGRAPPSPRVPRRTRFDGSRDLTLGLPTGRTPIAFYARSCVCIAPAAPTSARARRSISTSSPASRPTIRAAIAASCASICSRTSTCGRARACARRRGARLARAIARFEAALAARRRTRRRRPRHRPQRPRRRSTSPAIALVARRIACAHPGDARANAYAVRRQLATGPDARDCRWASARCSARGDRAARDRRAKAAIVRRALAGPITTRVPASLLQAHPNVLVVCDADAARALRRPRQSRQLSGLLSFAATPSSLRSVGSRSSPSASRIESSALLQRAQRLRVASRRPSS